MKENRRNGSLEARCCLKDSKGFEKEKKERRKKTKQTERDFDGIKSICA